MNNETLVEKISESIWEMRLFENNILELLEDIKDLLGDLISLHRGGLSVSEEPSNVNIGPTPSEFYRFSWPIDEVDVEEYPYSLQDNGKEVQWWDWDTRSWRPISELTLRKEVENSTDQPTPEPGEMESLLIDDDTMFFYYDR